MALPDPESPPVTSTGWSLLSWPLVIAIEDCFVPDSARLVIEVAAEQSSETHAILWALAGMKASGEWTKN